MLNWNCESSKFHCADVGEITLVARQTGPRIDWEVQVGDGLLSCGRATSMDEAKKDAETSLRAIAENLVKVLSC